MDFVSERQPSTAREGRSAHRFDMIDVRTKERSKVFVGSLDRADACLACLDALAIGRGVLTCLSIGVDWIPLLESMCLNVMFSGRSRRVSWILNLEKGRSRALTLVY